MLRYTICKLRAFLHFLMEGRSDYVLQHRHETNEIVCQVCSKNSRVHTSIRLCVIMNGEIVHSIFRTKHLLIYISWLFLLIDLESIKPRGLRCEGRNGSLAPPLILLRVLQMTKTPSCDLESLECKVNPVISYLRVIQPWGNKCIPYDKSAVWGLGRSKDIWHYIVYPSSSKASPLWSACAM